MSAATASPLLPTHRCCDDRPPRTGATPAAQCCAVVSSSLLTVLYSQVNHAMKIHDRLDEVTEELNEMKGIKPATPTTSRQKVAGGWAGCNAAAAERTDKGTAWLPGMVNAPIGRAFCRSHLAFTGA